MTLDTLPAVRRRGQRPSRELLASASAIASSRYRAVVTATSIAEMRSRKVVVAGRRSVESVLRDDWCSEVQA